MIYGCMYARVGSVDGSVLPRDNCSNSIEGGRFVESSRRAGFGKEFDMYMLSCG